MSEETKAKEIPIRIKQGHIKLPNPLKILNGLLKTLLYLLLLLLSFGFLFGISFIIGILAYIFGGNDIILRYMADVLTRIIEIKMYF